MFKFRPEVTEEQKKAIIQELKTLKTLDCVKGHRLVVGGPSINTPVEKTKGFEITLLSFHENLKKLEEYRDSEEHQRVTKMYVFPYTEDLLRFDFEVSSNDEYMWEAFHQSELE
ncbi:hypothetical protein N7474_007467 [Penicillium riverlandense]|uniref:uncharacterized protein n=1 Tax=Penicillium riverlandense TaxID=1903569 RepID=UPI002547AA3B|nr:uncharacterized protein N7474_007467 [Penicillium riverlandense]KAJ5815690.1 hypothetical protein N7474_007467 [Penicillium riverlandense]